MSDPRPAPVRCAVVPPVAVPYREPLFAALGLREALALRVIYASPGATAWDQPADWFPGEHPYDAVTLSARQRARPGRTPLVWARGLERALSAFAPECVVVSEFGPTTLRALAWCRLHRRPLVILTEVTAVMDEELSAVQRRLHGWLARRAAGLVAVSSAARARVEALGVPAEAVELSLQSADLVPLEAAAAHPRPSPPPVRLLTVGRLVEDKNVGRLLDAVARTGHGPDALQLEICGTGPLEPELRARADHLGIDVHFAGYVAPAGLAAHYARAHAFALLSTYEPFGVAVREAAAAGLPILCSGRAGAAGDLAVAGRNALLVDPGRTEEIAAALDRLVRDTRLREELAAESRAITAETPLANDVMAFERAILRAGGRLEPPPEHAGATGGRAERAGRARRWSRRSRRG